MRIGLSQFNPTVGDIRRNVEKMVQVWHQAQESGVDLLVFPELATCGYPPEDLLYKGHFVQDNGRAVRQLAEACPRGRIVVGFPQSVDGRAYNAAAVIHNGCIDQIYRKGRLPNFSVFDESRYFVPGTEALVVEIDSIRIAPTICYDLWNLKWLTQWLDRAGDIDLVLNISASPFDMGKVARRESVIKCCTLELNCAVAYCNLVGGQDELVFDGRSMIADSSGQVVTRARAFAEDLLIADIVRQDAAVQVQPVSTSSSAMSDPLDEVYESLVLGTRDYVQKNGFTKVLLGISGGIDSALTAALAVAALGPDNVMGITMPSCFNSPATIADAQKLADNLGTRLFTLPIGRILGSFNDELAALEDWNDQGLAYENLQARIRGTLLMSLSNQLGAMVLTTGNKSETSVGYSTLYGDTAGGFAVIKDVPKTMVYQLAEYINGRMGREVIPVDTITRAPSAELRPDQKDSDSLPDYEVLDAIVKGYVEQDKSPAQLIATGLPENEVKRIINLVDRNEYKRRQSPPGVKITTKAFGKDRRLPITNRYHLTLDTSVKGK
jgi:NAD+ synthase (glutamine-hydrolysing)